MAGPFAHSTETGDKSDWHLLEEHLAETSRKAGEAAGIFEAESLAALAGGLHDFGKCSPEFQARLAGSNQKVDHSTAGAARVRSLLGEGLEGWLLAHVIAGHHAGLPDTSVLRDRLKQFARSPGFAATQSAAEASPAFLPPGLPAPEDCKAAYYPATAEELYSFQLAFLGRMIFSTVVDADHSDTEAFYNRLQPAGHGPQTGADPAWPDLGEHVERLQGRLEQWIAALEADALEKNGGDTPVNGLRRQILEHVRRLAVANEPRAFTLTVPTGGGKTLASLAFALDHAREHGQRRIVYAIPFTSIIEQTAGIFRQVLGDEMVLEHHSSLDCPFAPDSSGTSAARHAGSPGQDTSPAGDDSDRDQQARTRRATQDWAAPVIVTTNVQLFESLFSNRPGACRKLHRLANSIIILDEAQTLPLRLLLPCLVALDELIRNYGVTVVFCTATLPALTDRQLSGPLQYVSRACELAPGPQELAQQLQRVTVLCPPDPLEDQALVEELASSCQGLVIVNSRRHALQLYQRGQEKGLEGLIHLTTRQHASDRRKILRDIRAALDSGAPCRVIATSLVECGVDLDFPRVWRAGAGLDQMAQAAGRCNREGRRRREDSLVTFFTPAEAPPPREIRTLCDAFRRMKDKYPADQLLLPEAITHYFSEVYWGAGKKLDKEKILDDFMLDGTEPWFGYQTVADKFRMIDSGLVPVIVPDGDGQGGNSIVQGLLDRLLQGSLSPAAAERALQPWIVQIPRKSQGELLANGAVSILQEARFGSQFVVLQRPGLYSRQVGLLWDGSERLEAEDTIF